MTKPHMQPETPGVNGTLWLLCAALGLLTLLVFWRVQYNDFLTYDDPSYVTENPDVRDGLTPAGVRGAFTGIVASNWQPVTVLSHALDASLYGLNPRGHHLTNIFLHIANTVLLFLFLFLATREIGKSAVVAAFFAVHPLHVESVAWIASRKDVLSTLFMLLALIAYTRYVRVRKANAYVLVMALFALGLMAKSMLVTFPFLLLVLDYWPLRRIDFAEPGWRERAVGLVREKVPLFVLTIAFAVIAIITQRKGGSLQGTEVFPLYDRVTNAIVSYVLYAGRVIWPSPLAVFYPYPEPAWAMWTVAVALTILIGISLLALRMWKSRPYILAGWLWFVGTLVPVIGLVQIGAQAMADRYTYITIIGVFMMLVWGAGSFIGPRAKPAAITVVALVLALCASITVTYAGQWRSSETLFRKTLEVTTNNFPAHINLGLALIDAGDMRGAAIEFEAATRVKPRVVEGWYNLGSAYYNLGEFGRAAQAFAAAANAAPSDADVHARMAATLVQLGRIDDAQKALDTALALEPQHSGAQALKNALNN
ncbi:MAG: tetratricopeptide repeat protein [Candidatus Hydrogenedentes bacterium]|nr:tetratricopeptide repeat protein [Candidatus Hydrogenedentota bacterium]